MASCTPTIRQEPSVEPVADLRAEPKAEPRLESRRELHLEPRFEPARELRQEPKLELRQEPTAEPRQEPKLEPRLEPVSDASEPTVELIPDTSEPTVEPGLERTTPDWGMPDDHSLEKVPSNINWASLQWPPSISVKVGQTSRAIYGQLYVKGLTDTVKAAHPGLRAELGAGPWGTTPQSHPSQWTWVAARYVKNAGVGGNNHEYSANLTLKKAGLYQYAYRFSLYRGPWQVADRSDYGRKGTDDGVSLQELGVAVVAKSGASLRIGSMNLHCLVEKPDQRFREMARQWARMQLDVIGLQEVCVPAAGGTNAAETLAALLKKAGAGQYRALFVPTHTATHAGVSYREGLGLLTRVPVLESKDSLLPASGTRPAGAFPRRMLWARLATPVGVVALGTVHLSYRRNHESWRVKQVETIKKVMASNETWASAKLVVGDFNAGATTLPIVTMKIAGQPSGTAAFVDLLAGFDTGFTFPAKSPSLRIDYLFFSQPSAAPLPLKAQGGQRLFLKPLSGGVYLSDHLGLRATLILR